jgi:tetratricopeptide (TPR) repeat protein
LRARPDLLECQRPAKDRRSNNLHTNRQFAKLRAVNLVGLEVGDSSPRNLLIESPMQHASKLAIFVFLAALFAAGTQTARGSDNPKMDADIRHLESEWARIKYQVKDEDAQLDQLEALATDAAAACQRYPGRAEPLVWDGIITSTEAGVAGGFNALSLAKAARKMFEQAGQIDPRVLDGAVPTSLGSLYYLVPGFPLGFGNDDKARGYLEQGVAMSPNGLDSNFFYGDFLFQQGEYEKAEQVLNRALLAPAHPDRPVWDAGRRAEINALMKKIREKLASAD